MFSILKNFLDTLKQISDLLDSNQEKLERMMATLKTFQDLLAAIDAETTRIATKIDDLVSKLAAGGMTDAEEQTVLDALTAESDRLKGIGVDPANPIPTP